MGLVEVELGFPARRVARSAGSPPRSVASFNFLIRELPISVDPWLTRAIACIKERRNQTSSCTSHIWSAVKTEALPPLFHFHVPGDRGDILGLIAGKQNKPLAGVHLKRLDQADRVLPIFEIALHEEIPGVQEVLRRTPVLPVLDVALVQGILNDPRKRHRALLVLKETFLGLHDGSGQFAVDLLSAPESTSHSERP